MFDTDQDGAADKTVVIEAGAADDDDIVFVGQQHGVGGHPAGDHPAGHDNDHHAAR
ncbi:hypothetical protein ACWEOZ_19525 [Actinoplanes sp. NPDC004185]